MAFEIRWTPRASQDLTRIIEYLDSLDPSRTDVVIAAIREKLEFLTTSPFLSAVFETSTRGDIREVLAASYRIFFTVNDRRRTVRIEAIRHVRQQDPDFSG
jgi:plasmid stabilization system protein ParE